MTRTFPKRQAVEQCWTLIGLRQGMFWHARRMRPSRGEPAQVAFDADWVLQREESKGDVVGFYHTHPEGLPSPSRRDVKTMQGWSSSFGKPLLCLIESSDCLSAYRFDDDESEGTKIMACERLPRGIVIAYDPESMNHVR